MDLDGVILFNSGLIAETKKSLAAAGRDADRDVAIACWDMVDPRTYQGTDAVCVEQPAQEIARNAVEVLTDTIEGKCAEIRQIILPTTLLPGNFAFRREREDTLDEQEQE